MLNTRVPLILTATLLIAMGCGDSATNQTYVAAGGSADAAVDGNAAVDSGAGGGGGADAGAADAGGDSHFSFFVTSLDAMRKLSGNDNGFGGDLGGLSGADGICTKIAATVGGGNKTWRAFLSVTKGADGKPVHAIERIGQGPWYDRHGRLVAKNITDLLHPRPKGHAQVVDDLPNELGQGQKQFGDNHDTLTGSGPDGKLANTDPVTTCKDWTSAIGPGSEGKVMGGHSWPRSSGGGTGPGGKLPPGAVAACEKSADGDPCTVSMPGGKKVKGSCTKSGTGQLGCVPSGKGGGGGKGGGKGGGGGDPSSWITAHTVPGCAPGVQLKQVGGGKDTNTVGGGGGYGGFYCFALEP